MITFNNAPTLEKAILSVIDLKDELVIVDSHSTDGTTQIAEKYADKLYQFDTNNLREKYQFAQDMCTFEWVLFLDADEYLTDELKREIKDVVFGRYPDTCDGYIIHRRNFYLGREIKYGGWYPDKEIRLYKKNKGRWEGGIHAKVVVDGKLGTLKNTYMHTPYLDIGHQINKINRYAEAYAWDQFNLGKRFSLSRMIFGPLFRFFKDYFVKMGFLDGIPGLIIGVSTMYYVFLKQGKLWEIQNLVQKEKRGHLHGDVQSL